MIVRQVTVNHDAQQQHDNDGRDKAVFVAREKEEERCYGHQRKAVNDVPAGAVEM